MTETTENQTGEKRPKSQKKVCKHSTYCDARSVGHVCTENSIRTIDYRSKCVFFEPKKD